MVRLYKDPKGEEIFEKASNMSPTMGLTANSSSEVESLRRRVTELESQLREKVRVSIRPEAIMLFF